MRTFLRAHWKVLVAIILLVLLALFTMTPSAAVAQPTLGLRLRAHVSAIASSEHNTATPARLEEAARYIETVLQGEGYAIRRQEYQAGGQKVRNIEVSVANVESGKKPARIFIVGAHYDSAAGDPAAGSPGANDNGSGTAAVLELARLLKDMRPSQGTEVKFVFFVNEEPPWFQGEEMGSVQHARQLHEAGQKVEGALVLETIGWYSQQRRSQKLPPGMESRFPDTGNFIAFVGTLESSRLVQDALSAFRAVSDFPAHGLAAPAYVQGVTFSDHSSYKRFGYPAIMITDTAFMRYPYYQAKTNDKAEDTPDKLDYDSTARVVQGLARTIVRLASAART
jgi:Zn-dependent M28 family amino/carboxypeptidase